MERKPGNPGGRALTTRLGAAGRIVGGAPRARRGEAMPHGPGVFRRVRIRPPPAACPACAARGEGSRAAAGGRPSSTRDRVHFALFAAMCAAGAFVFVDTGPFPLNLAFGAFAASLPLALAAWRFRAGRRRPR